MTLPPEIRSTESGPGDKAVLIRATGDIVVSTLNPGSCGMYTVLPIDALGNDYVISTWAPDAGEDSFFALISTQPDTTISITINGIQDSIQIAQQYGSYTFESLGDLTGTRISADKPIAMIAGNADTNFDSGLESDYVTSFLWPTIYWGSQHVVPAVPGANRPYYVKVTATELTLVHIHGEGYWLVDPGKRVGIMNRK